MGKVTFDSGYGNLNVHVEVYAQGAWRIIMKAWNYHDATYSLGASPSFTILSDGTNYRWRSIETTNGVTATLAYIRCV